MFEVCPQQYKFTYIDHLDKEFKTPKPYLTMGAHVHNALKDFYDKTPAEQRNYETAAQLLRTRWRENREGFASREDEALWGNKALNMLRLFCHRMDLSVQPTLLEDYYDADIDEHIKVIGRIDRADTLPDGTLHVIDYKTGRYDEEDVSDLQLQIYSLIASANRHQQVTKASYLYLQTMQWYTIDVTDEAIDEAAQMMKEQVQKILRETEFAPRMNKYCKNCDFLTICPSRQEVEKKIAEDELIAAAKRAEIAEKVSPSVEEMGRVEEL